MLLLLKLKKPFYLLGALWVPLCLGMEAPTQEPSKKEEEQKIAPLQKLPGELVAYLSTFLTSAQDFKEAIKNIKYFASTNPSIHSIINDPVTLGNLIELLSTHFNTAPLDVALALTMPAATEWLKSYFQKNPQEVKEAEKKLLTASDEGNLSLVQSLIKAGVSSNAQDIPHLETPLMMAASSLHPKVVKFLLESGANANLEDGYNKDTALSLVAKKWKSAVKPQQKVDERLIATVTSLIPKSNLNHKNKDGNTPLMLAAGEGNVTQVGLLTQAKADPNVQNKEGNTALVELLKRGDGIKPAKGYKIVNYLLEAGADPNIQGNYGATPLMLAAQAGFSRIVDRLIKAKADPNIRSAGEDGRTALTLAKEELAKESPGSYIYEDYSETIKLLKAAGPKE
jgi:uncharacterized protein